MKLVLHTKKYKINLNILLKNMSELLLLLLTAMIIVTDVFKLVIQPFITGNLTRYTIIGLATLIISVITLIITYDDLKQYIGG